MDENGDREIVDFVLKGYSEINPGIYAFKEYGFYNSTSNTIAWNESVYNLVG